MLFRRPPARFWQATLHEYAAAMTVYREMFCAESEYEKRRKFAIFKRGVEAADKERRWRQDLERRRRNAEQAGTPPGKPTRKQHAAARLRPKA